MQGGSVPLQGDTVTQARGSAPRNPCSTANRSDSELSRGFATPQGAHIGQQKFEIGCAPLLTMQILGGRRNVTARPAKVLLQTNEEA